LRALAVEPRRVALQRGQARDLHQALFIELTHADQFLLDQRDFLFLRPLLRGEALDLLAELQHALAQLRLLAGAAEDANLEQFGFARDHIAHLRLAWRGQAASQEI
jgi:hypothetical protein